MFDTQVNLIHPTKFRVNWAFHSGEVQNKFSNWRPWCPSWISDRNEFSYFYLKDIPILAYKFRVG